MEIHPVAGVDGLNVWCDTASSSDGSLTDDEPTWNPMPASRCSTPGATSSVEIEDCTPFARITAAKSAVAGTVVLAQSKLELGGGIDFSPNDRFAGCNGFRNRTPVSKNETPSATAGSHGQRWDGPAISGVEPTSVATDEHTLTVEVPKRCR